MRQFEIAIVGGGLSGSTAAAMLGRAGHDVVLVDPHIPYPRDFRSEKLDASQIRLLRKTGLADPVSRSMTIDRQIWIARFGRVVEKRPSHQFGFGYDVLVNAIRAQIPSNVHALRAKVREISTGSRNQTLKLSNDDEISARLVVLATGPNINLRENLGIGREVISPRHSISLGFDVKPVRQSAFDFRALTYYPEDVASRAAYLTLFSIGAGMRANLFVYRDFGDPWLAEMRRDGKKALFAMFPRLAELTGDIQLSDLKIRPIDFYVSKGYRREGIVLVGDAFAASCPAAGTGCSKVFTDVERLCNTHIPRWLETAGMGRDKIDTFYDDEVKRACDRLNVERAFHARSLATSTGLDWDARRVGRFLAHFGRGAARSAWEHLSLAVGWRDRRTGASGAIDPHRFV
jgi:2-polyprenyl-6-methoxyphenol hydroxylase-like FAD-dependent oxidoreductase